MATRADGAATGALAASTAENMDDPLAYDNDDINDGSTLICYRTTVIDLEPVLLTKVISTRGLISRLQHTGEVLKRPRERQDLAWSLLERYRILSELEQQLVVESAAMLEDLASPFLVHHCDLGVRAVTACCLAEVLRVYASRAPYTQNKLKNIFQFFLKQIKNIGNRESPYFANYLDLLKSLSTTNIVELVLDLNAMELVAQFVKDIFQPDFPEPIYGFLLKLLQLLVPERHYCNTEVTHTIISQLSPKRQAENSAAYQMAVNLCHSASDTLQRLIFSAEQADTPNMFEDAYNLILVVDANAYNLLWDFVPILEKNLKHKDSFVRALATFTLGKMITRPGSHVGVTFISAWKNWLDRRDDKWKPVRILWLGFCGSILGFHPELSPEVCRCLVEKLQDPDENVCLAAIKVVGQLYPKSAESTSEEVLQQVLVHAKSRFYRLGKGNLQLKDVRLGITEYLYIFNREAFLVEIRIICLPDYSKPYASFHFANSNETHMYKVLRTILDESAEYDAILKSNVEVKEHFGSLHNGCLEIFSVFLRQISLTIVSKSMIPSLVFAIQHYRRLATFQSSDFAPVLKPEHSAAEKLMKTFTRIFPNRRVAMLTSPDVEIVTHALKDVARFTLTLPNPLDIKKELDSLMFLALEGAVPQALNAAAILANVPTSHHREKAMTTIAASLNPDSVEKAIVADRQQRWSRIPAVGGISSTTTAKAADLDLHENMEELGSTGFQAPINPARLTSKLAALGQFMQFCPELAMQHSSKVTNLIEKELLLKSCDKDAHAENWVPFDRLHVEGALKVLGIKVLVKIVRGCKTPKEAAQHGLQVLGLLRQILEQGGRIVPNTEICLACKSHLRLTAYVSILKLCQIQGCELLLTVADHTKLALVTQEQSWEMRNEFFEKLRKYLMERSIPFKFALMFSMAANEPDIQIRQMIEDFFPIILEQNQTGANASQASIESLFPAFLHAISLHPYVQEPDIVTKAVTFIQFFLKFAANSKNASYLLHSAVQLKTLMDLHNSPSKILIKIVSSSKRLYFLSDLAQNLVQKFCENKGWSLQPVAAFIPYDKELFKQLPPGEAAKNLEKQYFNPHVQGKGWEQMEQCSPALKSAKGPNSRDEMSDPEDEIEERCPARWIENQHSESNLVPAAQNQMGLSTDKESEDEEPIVRKSSALHQWETPDEMSEPEEDVANHQPAKNRLKRWGNNSCLQVTLTTAEQGSENTWEDEELIMGSSALWSANAAMSQDQLSEPEETMEEQRTKKQKRSGKSKMRYNLKQLCKGKTPHAAQNQTELTATNGSKNEKLIPQKRSKLWDMNKSVNTSPNQQVSDKRHRQKNFHFK
ncbi:armadillo-type protein [Zopfochytrium polystomum]|nr:armadillo-type protein [Zopfochytrium polystomum]